MVTEETLKTHEMELESRIRKEILWEEKSGKREDEHMEIISPFCNGDMEALKRARERMLKIQLIPALDE